MTELLQEHKMLVFQLNQNLYGIPIHFVRSIEKAQAFTRVPFTPSYIKGIIYLRGEMIPILDLGEKIKQSRDQGNREQASLILVSIADTVVALLVDRVCDVYTIDFGAIKPPTAKNEFLQEQWVSGLTIIDSQLVTILDITRIINSDMLQHRNEGGKICHSLNK